MAGDKSNGHRLLGRGLRLWPGQCAKKNAAGEGVGSRCTFQHGDANRLDFPDESFDAVVSNYVYHNIIGADKHELLLETLRVLKKGGVFALNDEIEAPDVRGYGGVCAKTPGNGLSGGSSDRHSHGSIRFPPPGGYDDAGGFHAAGGKEVMQAKYAFQKGNMSLEDFRRKYPTQTMTLGNGKPFTYRYYRNPKGYRNGRFIDRRARPFRSFLPAF